MIIVVAGALLLSLAYYFGWPPFARKEVVSSNKPAQTASPAGKEERGEKSDEQTKSEEIVSQWYALSDQNDQEGLKKLLSKRWFEPQNKFLLDKVLSQWTFSATEKAKGYHGVTLNYKIISVRTTESVYGKVITVRVEHKFELRDIGGHRIREGQATFLLATEGDKEELKIRELQWKVLKDTPL